MKCLRVFALASFVVAWGALVATAEEAEKKELTFKEQFKAQLEEWLPGMSAEDIPDRQGPQQQFQDVCFQLGTPGREAERAEACQVIAEVLGTRLAKPARIWLLKQLEHIGREECVDAVARSLDDPDPHVRDAARRSLQNNPAPQAGAKLLGKLAGSTGTWRVGLINSLGARGDQASIGALAGLLRGGDQAAAAAAANALGKIGGHQAAGALKAALPNAPDPLKVRIADAYLRCADKLLQEGKGNEAAAIYDELYVAESPRAIRLAALKGRLNAAGDKARDMVLDLLESDDADAQAIAAGHVENLIGSGAMQTTPEAFAKMPASGQILLLSAMATTGDSSVLAVVVEAAKSNDQNVKLAALRAYVRVVTQPSDRPNSETLRMVKDAMDLATRADEKKLLLVRAANVRDVETLRWVVPYLDDPSLADAACEAVVELAHHRELRQPHKGEFDQALRKVIEICRDSVLVERAKRYLAGR